MNSFDYESYIMGNGVMDIRAEKSIAALKVIRGLKAIPNFRGRILDLGCGAGQVTSIIRNCRSELRVYGIDFSQAAIEQATMRKDDSNYLVGDVQDLPFARNSFDIVVGFDILEHVLNFEQTIKEVSRVLKNDGILHLHIPIEGNPYTLDWFLWKVRILHYLKYKHFGHVQRFRPAEVCCLLEQDFNIMSVQYTGHPIGQIVDMLSYVLMEIEARRSELQRHGNPFGPEKKLGQC